MIGYSPLKGSIDQALHDALTNEKNFLWKIFSLYHFSLHVRYESLTKYKQKWPLSNNVNKPTTSIACQVYKLRQKYIEKQKNANGGG